MAAVAGLRGTGDWGADERPKNFREMILFRNPNGTAPILALMARVQKESVDDAEFSWWDEPNDIIRLQVAGALLSGDQLIVVDSTDPTSSDPDARWGVAQHLKTGDLLLVEPAVDAAVFDHEVIRVLSVQSDTSFTAERGASGTVAAAIGDDAFLLKLGSNYAEGTGIPDAASRNPIKYSNFTQIFKTSYEVTGTAAKTRLRTGDVLANERKRKTFDHSRDMELSILFGQKSETTGANGKPIRTMDGIRKFIPAKTTTILANAWTIANSAAGGNNILDAVSPVFDFDSAAGDQRIVFAGNSALNRLNAAIHKATSIGATNINFTGGASIFGMKFQKLEFPQGSVFIKTHPLMSRHALYTNSMFILDFSAIRYRPLRGRDTAFKDNVQTKDEDVVRGFWQTEAGLEVSKGGLTCGYIGNFGATIA